MFKDNPAIQAVLEPGDRIVATMRVVERSRLVIATLGSLIFIAGWAVAAIFTRADFPVILPLFVACCAVNLWLWSRQHPYFIAVSERLLICHGVTWLLGRPTRLLFTAPLPAVSVTVGGKNPFLGTFVRYRGPGVPPPGTNLVVGTRSEEYLGLVLPALRAGGASVTP
jgi:hypothetical protein